MPSSLDLAGRLAAVVALQQEILNLSTDMDAVMQQSLPRIRVINERVEQELREVLTPEQRDRLDALRRRRPERQASTPVSLPRRPSLSR